MEFNWDESKLFYGLGAFLGVIAILYFGHQIIFDLSPTVKSFILLSATVMFLSSGEYTENGLLRSAFYLFSAAAYVIFLVYTFGKFNFSSDQVFLLLAASSAVFLALGYLRSSKEAELDSERAKKILTAVAVLLALTVVFDLTGAQPEYRVDFKDSVEVRDGEEFTVGTLEIRNDFLLSRDIEAPSFRGCLFTTQLQKRIVYISPDVEGIIKGSTTKRLDLNETVHSRPDDNLTVSDNYSVVRKECPEVPEPATLYLQENEGTEVLRAMRE